MKLGLLISTVLISLLVACSTVPEEDSVTSSSKSAEIKPDPVVPKSEPLSKTGNDPYVVAGILYTPANQLNNYTEEGRASWYGKKFHGQKTSSGEIYNMYLYSAAHKTLPIPSYIKVTNLANNKSLNVRVNDRGPFVGTRILDLSYAAARDLGFANKGTTRVRIESISKIALENPENVPDDGIIYLQTGVYSEQKNALSAKNELESRGYKVKLEQREDALYSVKVGPFKTAALAYNEKVDLEKSMRSPVMLITERQ